MSERSVQVPMDGDADAGGRKWFWYLSVPSAIAFVIVFQHLQLAYLAGAAHDDAWFVNKAISIASGHWFGPVYDKFTLMKGPGYPLFLAAVSASGIPVGLAEALLLVFATGLLCLNLARLTRAYAWFALIFAVTLWHPIFLTPRLLREGIYTSQLFLILALLVEIFLLAKGRGRELLFAVLFGVAFAWFWLTREEGAWIFPGLAIFLVGVGVLAWKDLARLRAVASATIVMAVSAGLAVSLFGLVNKFEYGAFQLVDFKDKGFNDALDALYSVQVGDPVPYLPVPKRVRLEVYKVSPHFAELRPFFDGQQTTPWSGEGCSLYPQTCGDIAGGWFVWALRDAAAAAGQYKTPDGTTAFFASIAQEIHEACARGALTCKRPIVYGLPYISGAQFANLLPRMWDAARSILWPGDMSSMRPTLMQSQGDPISVEHAAIFLNSRSIAPTAPNVDHEYVLSGWYMDSQHGWFRLLARNGEIFTNAVTTARHASPDLVAAFGDPDAANQRFSVPLLCNSNCMLEVEADEAKSVAVRFADLRSGSALRAGSGQLYLDSIQALGNVAASQDIRPRLAETIRRAITVPYTRLGGGILIVSLLACLATMTIPRWRNADVTWLRTGLLMALSLWALVGARCLLLALIHISFFPGVTPLYIMPAYYVAWVAGGLSLVCFSCAFAADQRRRRQPVAMTA